MPSNQKTMTLTVTDPEKARLVKALLRELGLDEVKPGVFAQLPQKAGRVTQPKPAATRKPLVKKTGDSASQKKVQVKKPTTKTTTPSVKKPDTPTASKKATSGKSTSRAKKK